MMLSKSVARAAVPRAACRGSRLLPLTARRTFIPETVAGDKTIDEHYPDSAYPKLTEKEDPQMNGGYINPPRVKRQFRDPHGDWWDKQERRNYGEPVHEDNDVLGLFSPYEYTWTTPGKGAAQVGMFIATVLALVYTVKQFYPDMPSYPKEYEGGLAEELGGAGAIRARMAGDPDP